MLIRTEIDYRSPLVLGDPVHVSLWLTELRAASATLEFAITSGDRLAATAVQRGLFVQHLDSGRPSRLTPDDRARFAPYVAPDRSLSGRHSRRDVGSRPRACRAPGAGCGWPGWCAARSR